MTDHRRKELKEYADNLCLNQHGGTVPGKVILECLLVIEAQDEIIRALRRPAVAAPEKD